jgi:FixJ family two-component response regulator
MDKRALISFVGDDQSMRESLPELLEELGFAGRRLIPAKRLGVE